MNIIYNCDAITHPLTGIGRYALNLGLTLQSMPEVASIQLFSHRRWLEDLDQTADDNAWLATLRRHMPFKYWALKYYHHQRCHHFKRLTQGMSNHVFHTPNFIAMPFDGPTVATFHDLSFIHHKATQPAYRLKFLDQAIPQTLSQVSRLITPSAFVKNEVAQHYGFPEDRITVTPLGVDPNFQPRSQSDCQNTLKRLGLTYKRFVLAVATQEPRKNLLRLLKAHQLLDRSTRQAHPLVLVGGSGWQDQDIKKAIKKGIESGDVVLTGYVDETTLHHMYASATLLAFPSLYEGFGLPIIEAMASGTPVLTSQSSAMSEVAGGHALLVNPLDTEDIKSQLDKGLNDTAWQASAQAAGLHHSQSFTWLHCGEQTLRCYQSMV